MINKGKRQFLKRSSIALLPTYLVCAYTNDGSFFPLALGAELPRHWKKTNAKMAHNLAGLYVKGKKRNTSSSTADTNTGWFDKGIEAGRSWRNDITGDEFEFVTHGEVSKKWILVRSDSYQSYFLVFRGTQTDRKEDIGADLLANNMALPRHLGGHHKDPIPGTKIIVDPTAYMVPAGFLAYWVHLYKEIDKLVLPHLRNSNLDFRVSGFSLGGVFALYAAWYLIKEKRLTKLRSVYTFGAPACANIPFSEALSKGIKNIYRVYADDDPIPVGSIAYHAVGTASWALPGKPIGIGSVGGGDGHNIDRYKKKIETFL